MNQDDGIPPGDADEDCWKPPGKHRLYYRMTMNVGPAPIEMSVVLPPAESVNLSTAHVQRIGGANVRDWEFRQRLYYLIGAATVKSGQIEAAMKRLLILSGGRNHGSFSVADLTWSDLHKQLKQRASAGGNSKGSLIQALLWGEEKNVKKIRDDFIHSYWWDFADVGVVAARFERKSDGNTMIGTLDDLKREVEVLGEYEMMLDHCVQDFWVRFYLPNR